MLAHVLRNIVVIALIGALHIPLIAYAFHVGRELAPGHALTDLSLVSLLILLLLMLLPYLALAIVGIAWNPQRPRLNEYIDT